MFRSTDRVTEAGVFAIGKFAGYPEFLRPDEGGEVLGSFDAWIDRGTMAAHERWGPAWARAFPMGAAHGFLWRTPRDEARLCGVIAPSRDAVGRDYPLAIAARFPSALVARAPHVVPLAFGDFLDAAYRVVDEARSIPMSLGELGARVQAIAVASMDDVISAEAEYSAWCQSTQLEHGWSAIFPSANPLDAATRALESIGAALRPFRGREDPDTSLVLRLPLGAGGVAAAALWFDVVRRICRWSWTVPSAFWAVDDRALLLPIGKTPASAFGELWRPDPGSEFVYDVMGSDPPSTPGSRLGEEARALREAGREAPMAAFLDALVR